ncbi:MAG: SirB2 family protein [Rhodoferax sp.]|nr:SirB2 family protein [Rhodoferax sp.]MBP9685058.1 SirB2 family protein [Rhodoferax sp.]
MDQLAATYGLVKVLHVSCVVISISLFVLRGSLELLKQPWRQWRLLRVAPHVIDTVLLSSALWMAWQIGQYPFVNGWLTAKVLALLTYIGLGMRAMGKNTPAAQKPVYFAAALLSVGYVVGVALTRSPSWGLMQSAGVFAL